MGEVSREYGVKHDGYRESRRRVITGEKAAWSMNEVQLACLCAPRERTERLSSNRDHHTETYPGRTAGK